MSRVAIVQVAGMVLPPYPANWKYKTLWVAAPFWIACLPCKAGPAEIRVRLQNYAHVSQSTLGEAIATASSTLRQAGVRVSWAECLASDGKPHDPACQLAVMPLDVQIRLIDEKMAKRAGRRPICMGFTIVAGELNFIAAAYVDRARELAANNLASQGEILGGIIAHEIGHLLEVTTHSEHGLMRAVWDDELLKALAKGRLWFTEAQARRITAAVSRRTAAAGSMGALPPLSSHRDRCSSEGTAEENRRQRVAGADRFFQAIPALGKHPCRRSDLN